MIDLRSDTVTRPTREMLDFMLNSAVGDDVYGEDPTVNELQEKAAAMFGKEAALFVPTGTMGNQICLNINTSPGDEVIIEADAHVFYYETGAPALLSGVQLRTIGSENGMPDLEKIRAAIRPDIYYLPKTSLICLENTHNRHGGTIIDTDYIRRARALANETGVKLHLDGARIWNAAIASGTSLEEYGSLFDTLSVCLSKGLGTPAGSLVLGSREDIRKALKFRKILGGGMRQAGILAGAAIFALDNIYPLLADDHRRAASFAQSLSELDEVGLEADRVVTNIVRFEIAKTYDAPAFIKELYDNGLIISPLEGNAFRAVFHYQVSDEDASAAIAKIKDALRKA